MSSNDPLAQLLGSFLGGGGGGGGGNLADLLGALTQGGAVPAQAGGAPQAGGLAGLLGQMSQAGDVPQQAGEGQPAGMPEQGGELGQLLGALLGGEMPPGQAPATGMPQAGGELGGLMGALLGSGTLEPAQPMGASQAEVGIGDILGAVLGGGGTGIGASPLLAPIANLLSEKLGLPPALAQAVVAFVLAKLFTGGSAGTAARMGMVQQGPGMQELLAQASSGQHLDQHTLAATGLPEELAQHTGMDVDTAAASLQQALKLLGPAVSDLGAAQ